MFRDGVENLKENAVALLTKLCARLMSTEISAGFSLTEFLRPMLISSADWKGDRDEPAVLLSLQHTPKPPLEKEHELLDRSLEVNNVEAHFADALQQLSYDPPPRPEDCCEDEKDCCGADDCCENVKDCLGDCWFEVKTLLETPDEEDCLPDDLPRPLGKFSWAETMHPNIDRTTRFLMVETLRATGVPMQNSGYHYIYLG